MPEPVHPRARTDPDHHDEPQAGLRLLSRSPHPYHHQSSDLLHPSDCLPYNGRPPAGAPRMTPAAILPRDSPFVSDSGTEADDEHYLRGLPAPRARLHKGLRGRNEALSGSSSPMLSPATPEHHVAELGERTPAEVEVERRHSADRARQARLAVRRYVEVALVAGLVLKVISHRQVQPIVRLWFPGKWLRVLSEFVPGFLVPILTEHW
ncbi:hypothetical protein IMZ48_45115 [Candidatus Bathyarchaeota archaeon]|nr:hypothetical protein [Candidatus Bathyarchaeota archaeon]